jgi:hypothetical protein
MLVLLGAVMRTAFAAAIASGLIVSLVLGAQSIQLAQANGIFNHELNGSPIITIKSPLNKWFSSNTVVVSFSLTRPSYNWTSSSGTSNSVAYVDVIVDGAVHSGVDVYSELLVPFSYSLNLTDLQNGGHSLQLVAHCNGVEISEMHFAYPVGEHSTSYEALSDVVSFTVYAPEATPSSELTPEPFPASLVMASSVTIAVVVVGLGLLLYSIKRK